MGRKLFHNSAQDKSKTTCEMLIYYSRIVNIYVNNRNPINTTMPPQKESNPVSVPLSNLLERYDKMLKCLVNS